MDHSAFTSLNSTRLVRLLSDLHALDIKTLQTQFAEKFGQMLHFSSAITLSSALEDVPEADIKPSKMSAPDIKNSFLTAQTNLVHFIATGFIRSSRFKENQLPTPESLHAHCKMTGVFSAKNKGKSKKQSTAYEPYQRFYINRQSNLDIKVHQLRSEVRDMISGISPALAQLAQIDKALSDSLTDAATGIYALIPKLLGKRFNHLVDIHRANFPDNPEVKDFERWMNPGGWISTFCIEMRELLLAELEVRLQPVAGMIDSLPQTSVNGTTDERKKQYAG